MAEFGIILAIISMVLSIKTMKAVKEQRASTSPECKNALNQRVLTTVKQYDKKGKQIVYCVVKLDGEELEHVIVNIQDFSVISANDVSGT